jgi:hypothetical protein
MMSLGWQGAGMMQKSFLIWMIQWVNPRALLAVNAFKHVRLVH